MSFLSPTSRPRLNEATGIILLSAAVFLWLCLLSYHCQDASWNTAAGPARPHNLVGPLGARLADLGLQAFGLAAFTFPVLLLLLAWKWVRSEPLEAPAAKIFGSALLILSAATLAGLAPGWRIFGGAIPSGGLIGTLAALYLQGAMNLAGTAILALTGLILAVYLVSTFSIYNLKHWFSGPVRAWASVRDQWSLWRERRRLGKQEKAPRKPKLVRAEAPIGAPPPVAPPPAPEIPIQALEEAPAPPSPEPFPVELSAPPAEPEPAAAAQPVRERRAERKQREYQLPATDLLNEPAGRSPYLGKLFKRPAAFPAFGHVPGNFPGRARFQVAVQEGAQDLVRMMLVRCSLLSRMSSCQRFQPLT